MSVDNHQSIGRLVGFLLVLTVSATPAAAQDSGTLAVTGERDIPTQVTTDPEILTLEASELLRSTAKVQIRFVQETECKILPGMVGRVQNIADILTAGQMAQRLKDKLKADIDATVRVTLFESSDAVRNCNTDKRGDPAHAAKKAKAAEKLIARGFEMLKPVKEKLGNITVEFTPWVRKVGSSGTELGEVKGTVKLKLEAKLDKENLRFLGGFKIVERPKFQIRNQPRSGLERRQAKEQYDAFKKRFTKAYQDLLDRLNSPSNLFKTRQELNNFKYGPAGNTVTKSGRRSIPFMGERYRWRISIKLTAGEWRDAGLPQTTLPGFEDGG